MGAAMAVAMATGYTATDHWLSRKSSALTTAKPAITNTVEPAVISSLNRGNDRSTA
jgi:hypothetical protein